MTQPTDAVEPTSPEPTAGEESDDDSPAVVSSRAVEVVTCLALLAFAAVMAWDNHRTGAGWAPDGPQAGYFPFYLSIILAGASGWGLVSALRQSPAAKAFVQQAQLRRVLQVFVPTALFCLCTQLLGLYVASFLLVGGFMRFVGRIAWWKSLLTSFVFAASMYVVFDVAFDVIMPKGPLEALLRR